MTIQQQLTSDLFTFLLVSLAEGFPHVMPLSSNRMMSQKRERRGGHVVSPHIVMATSWHNTTNSQGKWERKESCVSLCRRTSTLTHFRVSNLSRVSWTLVTILGCSSITSKGIRESRRQDKDRPSTQDPLDDKPSVRFAACYVCCEWITWSSSHWMIELPSWRRELAFPF